MLLYTVPSCHDFSIGMFHFLFSYYFASCPIVYIAFQSSTRPVVLTYITIYEMDEKGILKLQHIYNI